MKRLSEFWFEFAGVKSDAFGIRLLGMPTRTMPALRGKAHDIAGESGSLFLSDDTYGDVTASIEFDIEDPAMIPAVCAWLSGKGLLRFSDEPGYAYDARIVTSPRRRSVLPRMSAQRYSVTFTCHPFRRTWPEPSPITVTASGTLIVNPGNAPAKPRVTIAGSGDFMLSIGNEVMWFEEITDGGVIVDSMLMDALTYDGTMLANNKVSGTPFLILPGENRVRWLSTGGSVDSVTIEPRWRCF